jgi:hypothetical protein
MNSYPTRVLPKPRNETMNAVGGSTIHYDGNSWRFAPRDFRIRTEVLRR